MFGFLATALVLASTPQLTLRVDGEGYIRLAHGAKPAYAKQAVFIVSNGELVTKSGDPLLPRVRVPSGAHIQVDLDGTICAIGGSEKTRLGRIVLAIFRTGAGPQTGAHPSLGNPGEGLCGVIRTDTAVTQHATAPSGPTIEFAARAEIDSDIVRLGDVAKISASSPGLKAQIEAVELGRSPIYGASKGVSAAYVIAHLRQAGIKADGIALNVPEHCEIVRKSQTVPGASFVDAAIEAAKTRLGASIELRAQDSVSDLIAPTGELHVVADGVLQGSNSVTVTVWAEIGERKIGSRVVTLVPTAGSVGVRPGDPVRIRLISNGAVVEIAGKARTGGWVGSQVTVQADTGTVHVGVVKTANLVEVRL